MADTTYDVTVNKTETVTGDRGRRYKVRWTVAGRRRKKSFNSSALADGFRADLISASRRGVPFDAETGLPAATEPAPVESWYVFACGYADMKWPESAGKSRAGRAETLTAVTVALARNGRGRPSSADLRRALYTWSFNTRARQAGGPPPALAGVVVWVETSTPPVSELAKPEVLRIVMAALARKLDGKTAASSTAARKRAVLHNALEYAVERGLLDRNPLPALKVKRTNVVEMVDRRVVVNHEQATRLLDAVAAQGTTGRKLVAFFGLIYYAALRPAEAAAIGEGDMTLPADGWGELYLPRSAPTTGKAWADSGRRRDRRGLKHRPPEEVREVPCPPPLTAILRRHVDEFGTGSDGRLVRGVRGDDLSDSTYGRVWQKARIAALTNAEATSPLAGRPYDLRHAAVSTWLNAGVAPTQVAEWAGHSVAVLLRVYAKCIAGQGDIAREQISRALGLG